MLKKTRAIMPAIFAIMIASCSFNKRGNEPVARFQELDIKSALAAYSGIRSDSAHQDVFRVPIPTTNLAFEFPLAGYSAEIINRLKPYYFFIDKKVKAAFSFNFDSAPAFCKNSRSCRDAFVNKRLSRRDDNQGWMWQVDDIFVSEWWTDRRPGHRNMCAHFIKNGIWIALHWSKNNFREEDRELFVDLLRSIKFTQVLAEK